MAQGAPKRHDTRDIEIAGLDAIIGRSSVRLVEWIDHALDVRGVDPRSHYAERFWLPILGPTTRTKGPTRTRVVVDYDTFLRHAMS